MDQPIFDSLAADRWQGLLTTKHLGRGDVRCLQETDSTNLQLRQMALAGAPHGSLCLAEMQSAGRGRLGRSWHSPAGQGLWLSVLLRPDMPSKYAPLLTLCAAMAMAQAVRQTANIPCMIKWPNDLVCGGRKLCGVLLEISADAERIHHVIVGTGLNVRRGAYPAELAHQAASVEDFTAAPDRANILAAYLHALESITSLAAQGGWEALQADYIRQCVTIGSRVRVIGAEEFTGMAESLDQTGALLVRDDEGQLRRVLAGDVSVRGVMGYV
ncbi:MAG: biotin--[Clostridia bacterium]|nr:biotin--[acetyl-CoA-carboxylase] ligase [Clostridia bacterium]